MIHITGIPYVFGSLQSFTYAGYTYKDFLSAPTDESGDDHDLRAGESTAGDMSFVLTEDGTFLLNLFGYLSAANTTKINEEIPWGTAAIAVLTCLDTSLFAAGGDDLYRGLETMAYDHTAVGTEFHNVLRAQYGSAALKHRIAGTTDPEYEDNPEISDHPQEWAGRIVTLYKAEVTPEGIVGAQAIEWRGILQSVACDADQLTYTLQCKSLVSVLDRSIGCTRRTTLTMPESTSYHEIFWYIDPTLSTIPMWVDDTTNTHIWYIPGGVHRRLNYIIPIQNIYDAGIGLILTADVTTDDLSSSAKYKFINEGTTTITIHLEPMLAAALGFPEQISLPSGGELSAEENISCIFYGSTTDRIYVTDNTEFSETALADPIKSYIAVRTQNALGDALSLYRLTGTGTDVTDGDYLKVSPVKVSLSLPRLFQQCGIWSNSWDPIEAKQVIWASGVNPIYFFLMLLTSMAGDAANGSFDLLNDSGLALPSTMVDDASFMDEYGGGKGRHWLIEDNPKCSELIAPDLAMLQCRIVQRKGLLRLVTCNEPMDGAARERYLTDHDCLGGILPRIEQDLAQVVNRLTVSHNWDPFSDDFQITTECTSPASSRFSPVPDCPIEIEHKALVYSGEDGQGDLSATLYNVYNLRGRVVYSIYLQCALAGDVLSIYPGDVVYLTHQGFRNPLTGTVGVTTLQTRCWKIDRHWKEGTADLVLTLFTGSLKTAAYCPSAKITTYDVGTGECVTTSSFYNPSPVVDASYFQAGDKVMLVRASQKDEDDHIHTTVVSVSGTSIFVAPALVFAGGGIATNDRIRYDIWTTVTVTQKKKAFIASYTDGLINAADSPFIMGYGGL